MRLSLKSIRKLPPRRPVPLLRRQRWVPASVATEEMDAGPGSEWMVVYRIETIDGNGDPVELWAATRSMVTSESDTPADTLFAPLVAKGGAGSYRSQIFSGRAREAGGVVVTGGQASFINADGYFDDWVQYLTDDSRVTCYLGKHGDPFPAAWRKVFVSYIDGFPSVDSARMTLSFRGRERRFARDASPLGYPVGAGSENGITIEETGIAGSRKRLQVMGTPPPWRPTLVNATENIWEVMGCARLGTITLYDGGVPLELSPSASFGSDAPGTYQILERPGGAGVWAHLTSEIRFELRAEGTGRYASPTVSERDWTVCDLAGIAGVAADPTALPTGSENLSAGNRVVETERVEDVLADVARFEVAAIGMDRLDRFFARRLVPSFEGTPVYTFRDSGSYSDGNADGLRWAKLRGAEKRVRSVTVRAGKTQRSALAGIVEDDVRDRFSRDGWMVEFTAECLYTTIFRQVRIQDVDPTSEAVVVEIVGHEFADEDDMEAFALRYLRLFAARQLAGTLGTDLDFDTLAINLGDCVEVESARFGGDRQAIVIGYDVDLDRRRCRFDLWHHDEDGTVLGTAAPTADEIVIVRQNLTEGAGGNGAGSGATGRGDAAPQIAHDYVNLADKTSALATGESAQDFEVPYDMTLAEVQGHLSTAQTSGSIATFDVKVNTVSILSTKITIDNNERSSLTAATQPVISAPSLSRGDRVTFHVDQAGSGGKGPSVKLLHYPR